MQAALATHVRARSFISPLNSVSGWLGLKPHVLFKHERHYICCALWDCATHSSVLNHSECPQREVPKLWDGIRVWYPYMSPACSLLAAEPPKRIFRVWGRHGGPILVLRATHSATGCVPWIWNDQTGNTNRLTIRRVDSPYMSLAWQLRNSV